MTFYDGVTGSGPVWAEHAVYYLRNPETPKGKKERRVPKRNAEFLLLSRHGGLIELTRRHEYGPLIELTDRLDAICPAIPINKKSRPELLVLCKRL